MKNNSLNFTNVSIKAFQENLPTKKMIGEEKFLALSVFYSKGLTSQVVKTSSVRSGWYKSCLGIGFNSSYYDRAERNGWVFPTGGKGEYFVTDAGFKRYMEIVGIKELNISEIRNKGDLFIVNKKGVFSFDTLLGIIFNSAKKFVNVVDSYVDDSIIRDHLSKIDANINVKVIYTNDNNSSFEPLAKKYRSQNQRFEYKKRNDLHDRFIVVDDVGYVLGPSIKDAAMKSPAIVVGLTKEETTLLDSFFRELWK